MHTALLVSLPSLSPQTVKSAVLNQQVAPTIIKALGFDPNQLQAVQQEQIPVLPFLFDASGHPVTLFTIAAAKMPACNPASSPAFICVLALGYPFTQIDLARLASYYFVSPYSFSRCAYELVAQEALVEDWQYAQANPVEELAQLHHFTMTKHEDGRDIPF